MNLTSTSLNRYPSAGRKIPLLSTAVWLAVIMALMPVASANFNCTKVLHAVPNNNATTCQCVNTAYVFDPTNSVCMCSTGAIMIGELRYCIACASLANTNVTASTGNTSCACNAGFVWNTTWQECVLDCGTIPNSKGSPDGSVRCECNSPYSWNGRTNSCEFDCARIPNTTMSYNATNLTCNCKPDTTWNGTACVYSCSGATCIKCPQFYFYDNIKNRCQFNCYDMGADVVDSDPTVCGCGVVGTWDNTTKTCNSTCGSTSTPSSDMASCVIDCTTFNDTDGTPVVDGLCTCLDPAKIWQTSTLKCVLDCRTILNAVPSTASAPGSCSCATGYAWNAVNNTCDINCGTINQSLTNGTLPSQSACSCKAGYIFRQNKLTCDLNCLIMPYANQTYPQLENGTCVCVSGYIWNANETRCVLDCASINNTVASNTTSLNECPVKNKYYWDRTTKTAQINCSSIAKAYTARGTGSTKFECRCTSPYSFSASSLSCVINCAAITNISPTSSPTDNCTCNINYYWNIKTFRCDPICQNLIPGSSLINGKCSCQAKYTWVAASSKCVYNCARVRNANVSATPPNDTSCVCNTNYGWNDTTLSCMINCSNINNTAIDSLRSSSCPCKDGYGWRSNLLSCSLKCYSIRNTVPNIPVTLDNLNTCTCKKYYSWNSTTLKCDLNCSSIANTVGASTEANKCLCIDGFAWSTPQKLCVPRCGTVPGTVAGRPVNNKCSCTNTNFYFIDLVSCTQNCSTVCRLDCSPIPFAKDASPDSFTNCTCPTTFDWVDTKLACVANCTAMPQTNGTISDIECACNVGYSWNTTNANCTVQPL